MISFFANQSNWAFLSLNIMLALGLYVMAATGQLSLGQGGFMAVGAYASSYANVAWNWPVSLALPFGIVFGLVVAVPVAIAANRVRGLYLIIGTLAFSQVVTAALTGINAVGGGSGYRGMDGVSPVQIVVTCAVVVGGLILLMRTRLGLAMRSIRQDEDAAEAVGVPTRAIKIGAVILGAGITALAGGLSAQFNTYIHPDRYGFAISSLIALYVIIGGSDNLLGPIVGAFLLTYVPDVLQFSAAYRPILYGAFLLVVIVFSNRGLVTRSRLRALHRLVRRATNRFSPESEEPAPARAEQSLASATDAPRAPRPVGEPEGGPGAVVLRILGLTRHFEGVVALNDVDLDVRGGEILGLIGPNGAGKTTLINVATGLISASGGSVTLLGEDTTRLPSHRRVKLGMARTFQAVRLFPDLAVRENIAVAADRKDRPTGDRSLLERFDLGPHVDRLPGELPFGVQRKVQIAQALATRPTVVFLDEPSVGMNPADLAELASIIDGIRREGTAVLLVDHNLDLVMDLADRIAVLDFGSKIAEGLPDEVRRDEQVQVAYLGLPVAGGAGP